MFSRIYAWCCFGITSQCNRESSSCLHCDGLLLVVSSSTVVTWVGHLQGPAPAACVTFGGSECLEGSVKRPAWRSPASVLMMRVMGCAVL